MARKHFNKQKIPKVILQCNFDATVKCLILSFIPMNRTVSERTVKRLRLSKALTIPENMTVYEACRRMAARRVDAVLLTDSNALLCGILTDKVHALSFLHKM